MTPEQVKYAAHCFIEDIILNFNFDESLEARLAQIEKWMRLEEQTAALRQQVEALKTGLKHMTQWKNIKDETATVFMHQVKRLQDKNEALTKERDELRRYLKKFGTHSQTCPRMMAHPLCTCGYDDLVKERSAE